MMCFGWACLAAEMGGFFFKTTVSKNGGGDK
jgi:hypothetical protein